jgi:hypothetical protein
MRKLTRTVKLIPRPPGGAGNGDARRTMAVASWSRLAKPVPRTSETRVTRPPPSSIAVLHDLNLATLFAERIVVLDRGRIAADGPPRDTITDPMLERVFGIAAAVGRTPGSGIPFVLPHTMSGAPHRL